MRFLTPTLWLMLASTAFAQETPTPRDNMAEALTNDLGEPTMWLLGTAIAMFIALYAVHRSIFPKK